MFIVHLTKDERESLLGIINACTYSGREVEKVYTLKKKIQEAVKKDTPVPPEEKDTP